MKLHHSFLTFILASALLVSCSKSNNNVDDDDPAGPEPGSKRTLTVDITYYSGLIPGSTSWAVWPMAKFPVDATVKSYSVKLFNFHGTFVSPPEGMVYTWKPGQLPPTPYNIWKDQLDIKDGNYYMAIDRTWCAGCTSTDPNWIPNYHKGWGEPKAEITYQY